MKKWLIFLVAAAALPVFAALGELRDGGLLEVRTPHYSLVFFPGHMFPVELKLADGTAFPDTVFFDRIVDAEKRQYYLRIDRFAERHIIRNDADTLIVELTGNYCLDETVTAPGRPQAVYRYECRRDTPEIRISATITRTDDTPWKEVHFLQPAWKGTPWIRFLADRLPAADFRPVNGEAAAFTARRSAVLDDGKCAFAITSPAGITAWNNGNRRYVSYLRSGFQSNWTASERRFQGSIALQKSQP